MFLEPAPLFAFDSWADLHSTGDCNHWFYAGEEEHIHQFDIYAIH